MASPIASSSQARNLASAIEDFLNEPAPGTPPPVMAGLQNLLDGLRASPAGEMTPGQRAAREVGLQADQEADLEDSDYQEHGTPGQRAAVAAARERM